MESMLEQFEKLKLDIEHLEYLQIGKITRYIIDGWEYEGVNEHGTVLMKIFVEGRWARVNIQIDGGVVNLV